MSKKKLFRVTVETTIYVAAEHEMAAVEIVQKEAAKREIEHAEIIARAVKQDLAYVDPEWRNVCPYGAGEDERTCAEWVAK